MRHLGQSVEQIFVGIAIPEIVIEKFKQCKWQQRGQASHAAVAIA